MGIRRLSNSSISTNSKLNKFWDQYTENLGDKHYITVFSNSQGDLYPDSITSSLDGSTSYFAVRDNLDYAYIIKIDSTKGIVWQRRIDSSSAAADNISKIQVASSGNVYVCGDYSTNNSGSNNKFFILKYDSNGDLLWNKTFNSSLNRSSVDISLDSSENIYFCGGVTNANGDGEVLKLNSSGERQWSGYLNRYVSDNINAGAKNIVSDIFVCGGQTHTNGAGSWEATIYRFNVSNGSLSNQIVLTGPDYLYTRGIAQHTDGSIYATLNRYSYPDEKFYLVKYNSSLSKQWDVLINQPGNNIVSRCQTDSSGNVYIYTGGSDGSISLLKINSSGTTQWQRRITFTSSPHTGSHVSLEIDNSGSFYIAWLAGTAGSYKSVFAKLPTDGSKTGTYSVGGFSFTYESTSFSTASPSVSSTTPTMTYTTTTTEVINASILSSSSSINTQSAVLL
jgi:hypothetical protein